MLSLVTLCLLFLPPNLLLADPDTQQLRSAIVSPNQADRDNAVAAIAQALKDANCTPRFYGSVRDQLLPAMMRMGMFDQVASLSQQVTLNRPLLAHSLQLLRVKALLAADKPDEALVAAKSFFNVCTIPESSKAIDLVSKCLRAAKGKDDPAIADKFRAEQVAGAGTPSSVDAAPAPSTAPTTDPSSAAGTVRTSAILASIQIDPEPYAQAIGDCTDENGQAVVAHGNLLLMAGRAAEAETLFRNYLKTAEDNDLQSIEEGVARSIRAEDGTIGRANAYILSLKSASADAKP